MPLKKLIVVRHGDYGGLGLTELGKRQIDALTRALSAILTGSKILLLSSTASRAKETSLILAAGLGGLKFDEYACLYAKDKDLSSAEVESVSKLIEENTEAYDVIILSTHMEFIDQFPTAWGGKHGFQIPLRNRTPNGYARIIDVETGEVECLNPILTQGRC